MRYQCWNPRCVHYAGAHVQLRGREVFDFDGRKWCTKCGRRAEKSIDDPPWYEALPWIMAAVLGILVALAR